MAAEPATVEPLVHTVLDRLAGEHQAIGIALSGGGDSMALMHLAHGWGRRPLFAATVDHGLRAASADEAQQAGLAAASLGISHEILRWTYGGDGNLMAAAREGRLRLLSDWARRRGLSAVLLGHTLNDQAETLLMRLNRGAGVDGLSAMAPVREAMGVTWLRPLLEVSRADLRQWLRGRGISWADDPSNENEDYERVRVRKAIAALDLPMRQIARSAANLSMARSALCDFAARLSEGAFSRAGSLALPLDAFRGAPVEIRRRLLVAGLRFVSGAAYPPRGEPVLHALEALADGARLTLDGVILQPRDGFLLMIREPAAARRSPPVEGEGAIWDRRWRIKGLEPGQQVRVLGHEPLPDLEWRALGLTRDEAAATPGIWAGRNLAAAPALQPDIKLTAQPLRGLGEFRALLYTH
ncbi:tRNA lysidine(34) synthetase TilS [Paracoccus kondratievae]|uniref:tRNA lysidine(34) synthetase TilS n=1 Tax=Paracoccus kondratievae TaxID=135740 RepID=UPI0012668076|nr:tRNA lysidine(34) synthetase TilS [Paracoccus kondratievae]QFQ87627.1 tRNA lysidine(34) synthetase TilS [Paracoccus kondratievae]